MSDEFYIGWEAKAAPGIGRPVGKTVVALLLVVVLVSAMLAAAQRMIGPAVFEWGQVKTFTGILRTSPYPHLLVPRPGAADDSTRWSVYHLVAPWKFGLKVDTIASFVGQPVTLQGTLIYRDGQTMIEVQAGSIQKANISEIPKLPEAISIGKQTLVGEIVDSKCFLGVMNPGQLTPHRACAIRCISGGVPPVLLVRQENGPAIYLLLVSADGKPVNQQVLRLVAEPVEISGEVERQGDLLILKADPNSYRRVK